MEHPDKGSYISLGLSTAVFTCGTMCPAVGLHVLQKWGRTGEGPEDACQDRVKGPNHMTCCERLRDLGCFGLVTWRLSAMS